MYYADQRAIRLIQGRKVTAHTCIDLYSWILFTISKKKINRFYALYQTIRMGCCRAIMYYTADYILCSQFENAKPLIELFNVLLSRIIFFSMYRVLGSDV